MSAELSQLKLLNAISAEIGNGHAFPSGTRIECTDAPKQESVCYTIKIPHKGRTQYMFSKVALRQALNVEEYVIKRIAKIIKLDLLKQLN